MCRSVCGEGISFLSNIISTLHLSLLVCFFSTDLTDLEPARLRGKDLIRFMCTKGRSSPRLEAAVFLFQCGVYLIFREEGTGAEKKSHYFSNQV